MNHCNEFSNLDWNKLTLSRFKHLDFVCFESTNPWRPEARKLYLRLISHYLKVLYNRDKSQRTWSTEHVPIDWPNDCRVLLNRMARSLLRHFHKCVNRCSYFNWKCTNGNNQTVKINRNYITLVITNNLLNNPLTKTLFSHE